MALNSALYATQLRREIAARNRIYARERPHVESYGDDPVIVYLPDLGLHGNFFDPAYEAMVARPDWFRRLNKVHAQCRALPKSEPGRKWRELDSCMSSDALLMNIFCTPGVADSPAVQRRLGVEAGAYVESLPAFGWKARVPLNSGRFDRTEVDMRWGDLLVEAKLTETGFQTRKAEIVEAYRDFDEVFDRDRLPRVLVRTARRRTAMEFPEEFTQEWEEGGEDADAIARTYQGEVVARADRPEHYEGSYAHYQLIRNVLAAHAHRCNFCVLHDERRPDLQEAWFQVMAAVRSAELRVRLKVFTWQELAAVLPEPLSAFLDAKYGVLSASARHSGHSRAKPVHAGHE